MNSVKKSVVCWAWRASLLLGAVLLSLVTASVASANIMAYEDSVGVPSPNYGTLSQLNAGVTGTADLRDNSCVPTSVANGLMYLNNNYVIPNLIMGNGYPTVNTLSTDMGTTSADGTFFPDEVSGLKAYLSPAGQNVASLVQVGSSPSPPSPDLLLNSLALHNAVQIWISWSGGGAHSVSLYGMEIDTAGGPMGGGPELGTGTLSFLDPFGGTNGGNGSAVNIATALWTTVGQPGGKMFIYGGYAGGAAGSSADKDNTGAASTGYITTALAEAYMPQSDLPEPSAAVLSVLAAVCLWGASTLRRRNALK